MKHIKTAILGILGAACLSGCEKTDKPFSPGTGVVEFGETELMVTENSGLFTVPLVLTGEPGGYPVTVKISAECGNKEVEKVLMITSTTIKISEENDSFVQMKPVRDNEDMEDYEVTLTIESVNGANIGAKSSCTIYIANALSPRLGQYTFESPSGVPSLWTLILREGANGTYIVDQLFGLEYAPKLIGIFDEPNNQLVLDGRINGLGAENYFTLYGWEGGKLGDDYLIVSGSGSSGREAVIFYLNETNMELVSTNSSLSLTAYNEEAQTNTTLGSFQGGTLTFEGESIPKPWPFQ